MPNVSPSSPHPLIHELPKARFWDAMDICLWEGFWFEPNLVEPAITFPSTFQARDHDVLLASTMKTGTTWLKALSLCIIHNKTCTPHHKHDDILTTDNPHFHVPTVESRIYSTKTLLTDLHDTSAPRLLHTHLPYAVLPDSIKNSSCKIVYIARNPKDTLISMWHFFNSILRPNLDPFPLERAVECFCFGVHQYGSYFDHVAQYWQESRKRPRKILFVKYEELKRDPRGRVSEIAEFMGKPFGDEKEADEVVRRCSLERLKGLEVNKSGCVLLNVPNSSFFRKGEVGDWRNYFTPQMEDTIDRMTRLKFEPFGLFF